MDAHADCSSRSILVHLHIFYTEQWPELRQALQAIPADHPWDLWVTMVEEHPDTAREIRSFKPQAHIEIVANRGYDTAAFLEVLRRVELSRYRYCMKLHTKRTVPATHYRHSFRSPFNLGGGAWRRYLMCFATPEHLPQCLHALEHGTGMVGDHRLIRRNITKNDKVAIAGARDLLRRLHLPDAKVEWVAGTMFICRAELLAPLQQLQVRTEDFPPPDADHSVNLAHVVEALLGGVITAQGQRIEDAYTPAYQRFLRRLAAYAGMVGRFLLFTKRTRKNRLLIKVCKIPVFSMKLPAEEDSTPLPCVEKRK